MERGLPLFASTIATPVLRREASTASTRIILSLKSTGSRSTPKAFAESFALVRLTVAKGGRRWVLWPTTWNRQIHKHPFYSRRNVERFAPTNEQGAIQ